MTKAMIVGAALVAVAGLGTGTAEAGWHVGIRVGSPAYRPAVVYRAPVARVWVAEPVVVSRGHGALDIEVEPDRARVYVDGDYVGRGDTRETLRSGRHTVRVVLSDGREVRETVTVEPGRTTRLRIDL